MPTTIATDSSTQPNSDTMNVRVYNTLSRKKELLQPVEAGKVGIYLCGPTVYKESHIGHMVGPVVFDTIKRYLTYCGLSVNWVVNITDVDDKLIAQSRERSIPMSQIATEMTMDYCANLLAMGVDQISSMPRATEHMGEIIEFIRDLVEKDFAYETDGDVFFDVSRDDQYGKLSNRSADSQQGEGGDAAAKKRSPSDFALWKAAKPGEPSWDSPWGAGRPGWHIECSAMSRRLLGKTFDIHGGGLDLIFPHHENEIAQSECCHGRAMANIWMHNGLLRAGEAGKVGGRAERAGNVSDDGSSSEPSVAEAANAKLSRSKGAGGLHGLISRFGGERIRFFLLRTHYRSTIVFNDDGIEEAGSGLEKFYLFFERYQRITGEAFYLNTGSDSECRHLISTREAGNIDAGNDELLSKVAALRENFLSKMDDDFNSGAAVSDLFQLLSLLNKYADQQHLDDVKNGSNELEPFLRGVETLRELSSIFGLFLKPVTNASGGGDESLVDDLMQLLIDLRTDARANKDFATADKIRDTVTQMGIAFEDGKDGTRWRKS